jgi:hypothetical protein
MLVTLDKGGKAESFQYRDRFLFPTVFQWESQNRTRLEGVPERLWEELQVPGSEASS